MLMLDSIQTRKVCAPHVLQQKPVEYKNGNKNCDELEMYSFETIITGREYRCIESNGWKLFMSTLVVGLVNRTQRFSNR